MSKNTNEVEPREKQAKANLLTINYQHGLSFL